jgi:hypothetical protein
MTLNAGWVAVGIVSSLRRCVAGDGPIKLVQAEGGIQRAGAELPTCSQALLRSSPDLLLAHQPRQGRHPPSRTRPAKQPALPRPVSHLPAQPIDGFFYAPSQQTGGA